RERDLTGGDCLAGPDDADDLRADALDRDVERLQHARGETLLLAQQAEEDVLRADVVVLQDAGLLLCEDDYLPGPFCEAFEHCGVSWSGSTGRVIPRTPFRIYRRERRPG